VEDLLGAVTFGEGFGFDDDAARGWRLRELEVNDGLVFGDLDALDFFEFLDAGLDLFSLGGLGAKAIDEGLEVFDLYALVAKGCF
jgi:hypothetical protein